MDSLIWGLVIVGAVVAVLWYRGKKAGSTDPSRSENAAQRSGTEQANKTAQAGDPKQTDGTNRSPEAVPPAVAARDGEIQTQDHAPLRQPASLAEERFMAWELSDGERVVPPSSRRETTATGSPRPPVNPDRRS
ncbi:hypothetical protein BJ994_001827 [Arthrobacter pigmenti]|uniref:Uncharacterized protein n=1 Tax=Arthrobacter pigmenti TaxID=271432 RepID=A0A846RX10_9MICC|nr:hypothetical protein [Arthrobacter pigmenti]NJC22751.1 hypothetical protein [Arthrobacter pigmenti]